MLKNDKSTEWMVFAQQYLSRLGQAEYQAQLAQAKKERRQLRQFTPSDYMNSLIKRMNENDEEGFKALKMLEGRSSVIGV